MKTTLLREDRRFAATSWVAILLLAGLAFLPVLVGCEPSPANAPVTVAEAPPVAKPTTMEKWAGIDVGSKGVKPIVMGFTKTPSGWDFSADTTLESKNTDLGTLAENGKFDPKNLANTVAAIAELEKAMREKHALPADRVHVVVSSGVFTRFQNKDAVEIARKELATAIEKAIGRAPDFINEQQEAEYAVRGIITPSARADRLLIDIGSGNTKFGWYIGDKFQSFTLNSGTKGFRDAVAKHAAANNLSFADALAQKDTILTKPLKEHVSKAEGFAKLTRIQIIGGAAWALATFTHPGSGAETNVDISAADVEKFASLAKLKPDEAREKALAVLTDPAMKAAGTKELTRVQKVFTPEELQAAAKIIQVIFVEAQLSEKRVSFYQKGQYAWIAGDLMDKAKLSE